MKINAKTQKNSKKPAKKVNSAETEWYTPEDWDFRNNKVRKKRDEEKGEHHSLVVGKNGKKLANIGTAHQEKRGHHKNIPLSRNPNPKDKQKAFLRDDLQYHDEKQLKEVLKGFRKLTKKDQEAVMKIINKKRQPK